MAISPFPGSSPQQLLLSGNTRSRSSSQVCTKCRLRPVLRRNYRHACQIAGDQISCVKCAGARSLAACRDSAFGSRYGSCARPLAAGGSSAFGLRYGSGAWSLAAGGSSAFGLRYGSGAWSLAAGVSCALSLGCSSGARSLAAGSSVAWRFWCGNGARSLAARRGPTVLLMSVRLVPDVGFPKCCFVQFPGPVAGLDLCFRVLALKQAEVRVVVQEKSERLCTIGCVFHGVENVVMPKSVDIECRGGLFARKSQQQI